MSRISPSTLPPPSGMRTLTASSTTSVVVAPDSVRVSVPTASPGLPGIWISRSAEVGEVQLSFCTMTISSPTNARAKDGMSAAGYRASHSMTVTTKDLTGFGRLLNAAVDAAGNDLGLDQLQFDVAEKKPLLDQARELAFAQARAKAAHLAALAGQSLGSIAAVTETYGHAPFVLQSARKASEAYDSELRLTPGEQTIEVSLDVRWHWA